MNDNTTFCAIIKLLFMTKKGFTLLEILLAVGAVSILAGIVIVAINPGKQLATARNTTRLVDVHTIADAIYQYTLDHDGTVPGAIVSSTYTMLGTSASGCALTCNGDTSNGAQSNLTVSDQTVGDFSAGTFSSTLYNYGVILSASSLSGTFTSAAKDSSSAGTVWSNLAWAPDRPVGKELPGNGGKETAYSAGNFDMTGNILLLHLNEANSVATFADASGKNNNASCAGSACPAATTGKFNGAFNFDGVNDVVTVPYSTQLDTGSGDFSFSVFFLTSGGLNNGLLKKGIGPFNLNGRGWEIRMRSNGFEYCTGNGVGVCTRIGSNGGIVYGQWEQVSVVVQRSTNQTFLYLNGALRSTIAFAPSYTDNLPLEVGHGSDGYWPGKIDEIALFSRALSTTEISDIYKRGMERLKFQARSCSDASCANQNFVGPDGTAASFYSELNNNGVGTPSFPLNNLSPNRYLQYQATFETDVAGLSPILRNVNFAVTVPPPGASVADTTADVCLNLESILVDYVNKIPIDPKLGSADKTYYAVKTADRGKIMVKSCKAELGQDISTVR